MLTVKVDTPCGKGKVILGRVQGVKGRGSQIKLQGPFSGQRILEVTTVGKEAPTFAKSQRTMLVLRALQDQTTCLALPFFKQIWLPGEQFINSMDPGLEAVSVNFTARPLNKAQHMAVSRIVSDNAKDRIVMIQGPPGSGKTTVIAASVCSITSCTANRTIWIVAQSNVAVKNVAEKLASVGFWEFRILVSKEFHFEW
jgi:hypothetical protein